MARTPASHPSLDTAPVLAILVCHNGETWLPLALSALRRSTVRPRHVLAVDTGSTDRTPELLADADDLLEGVLTLDAHTGFAEAVNTAVEHAVDRWGDPGSWLWLLHDDCAPEPECLDTLLTAADASPSAGVLGPLALDWSEPRLIVEAGLSTDASGHRRQVGVTDPTDQSTEVLAVPSAGALIERELWHQLGGLDTGFSLLREDIDLGWRANAAGRLVLSVPMARLRHARAVSSGRRTAHALTGSVPAADRAHGLRTFLVNCGRFSFALGLVRLVLLCALRGLGFALTRRPDRADAEFTAIGYLCSGRAGLRAARADRARRGRPGSVRGLFTSRLTRFADALRAGTELAVRRRVASEAALGRLPEDAAGTTAWIPPEAMRERANARAQRRVGPDALPAGASRVSGARGSGLRRPSGVVAVALPEDEQTGASRPSPGEPGEPDLVFVELSRRRILAATLFAPPVVLFVALTGFALLVNGNRLGLDLAGGALLPVGRLGEVWATYLAGWHPVAGGTSTSAPAALTVLGVLGGVLAPLGGPPAAAAVLLIGGIPLAALAAYAATRKLRVRRWVRAGAAAAYALLPAGIAAVAQGRLDVVVVQILLPLVLAGLTGVLVNRDGRWLHRSVLSACGLALLGAFSPIIHALLLLGLVAGFVLLPAPAGLARRIASVAIVVVLPLALLLPWTNVLLDHPALLLHGVSGPEQVPVDTADLLGLDPGGFGGLPAGLAVLVAALVAVIVRPTGRITAGAGVLVLGVAGVVVLRLVPAEPVQGGPAAHGFTGAPLLLAGAGLLWIMLAVGQRRPGGTAPAVALPPKLGIAGGAVVLLVLAAGVGLGGREGPVRAGGGPTLASSPASELAATGRSALVLGVAGEPVRLTGGRLPRYGDDALVPSPGAVERLTGIRDDLFSGNRERIRDGFASAAASGALFVVFPPGVDAARLVPVADDLVATAPPDSTGRQVLRLKPVTGQVTLVAPEVAKRAVSGLVPDYPAAGANAISPVPAGLPDVRVRASEGPPGRLLVLAAAIEPGWRATVNGHAVPIVRAWGDQIAVAVPAEPSEIAVERESALRDLLLLAEVAALLFALFTAIPSRRRTG